MMKKTSFFVRVSFKRSYRFGGTLSGGLGWEELRAMAGEKKMQETILTDHVIGILG